VDADTASWQAFVQGWEIFRDPVVCGVAAGAVLGFLGVYVVLRRMVFVSAAVTQSAGLGVALAFYIDIHAGLHIDPLLGAAAMALLTTLAVSVTDARTLKVPREALLGLAFALSGGAAIIVGDHIAEEAHDIESILFGSAVLVRPLDLTMVLAGGLLTLGVHVWWFRGLSFAVFDRDAARVQGLPVRFLNGVLFVTVGLMVGIAARALGALPVFAFSVLPATAVLLFGLPIRIIFALSCLLGALAGGLGYVLAFFLQLPVGGSQTVVAASYVVLALMARAVLRLRRA
jgi:zinc transport system permease protein